MIFEIDFDFPQLQVSFALLKKGVGAQINIYFFSRSRYEYVSRWTVKGEGNIQFTVENEEGERVGTVSVTSETDEEREIINKFYPYCSREKETDCFLLLPLAITEIRQETFQYKKNFPQ